MSVRACVRPTLLKLSFFHLPFSFPFYVTSRDPKRLSLWPRYHWGAISLQRCQMDAWWQSTTHMKSPTASRMVTWLMTSRDPKGQGRDPVVFVAPYLHNGARWTHGLNGPLIGSCPPRVSNGHVTDDVVCPQTSRSWPHYLLGAISL